jgi:hypothetical protein
MAGISHLLGATAPATMMEPAADNPTGFWESNAISEVNEAILSAYGCHWYDSLPFGPVVLNARFQQEILTKGTALLAREFGDASLFVLKDPRFSLTLDLWRETFIAMNVTVAPLLALRHPTEVIASLRRRDNMPSEVAAPLWLHYTLQAEYITRNGPRAVLSYDRFLQDWRGSLERITAEAGIAWPVNFDAAAPAIGEFLRPQLRHHYATPRKIAAGRPPVSDWIAETYDSLRRVEAGERAAQFARLDQLRAQLAAWRAAAPRVSFTAAAGQEPLTTSGTPQTTSASSAASPGRSVSFR